MKTDPSSSPQSRILIFGAGAVGTYLGGLLGDSGFDVAFLEREKDLPHLTQRGLLVADPRGKLLTVHPRFYSSLEDIALADFTWGIMALKTYHLESIAADLIRFRDLIPPLLSLQNGLEAEETLRDLLGSAKVIPGTVTSAISREEKGSVVIEKARGVGIADTHPLSKDIYQDLSHSGVSVRLYSRPRDMKWSKALSNLLGNASSAILDLPPGEIYSHPGLFKLERAQLRETLQVMRAKQIRPVNLPGVPVRLLAWVIRFLPEGISRILLQNAVGSGRGEKMPSFHIDLQQGQQKSEVDDLNGAVVRAAEEENIAAPANRLLRDTLLDLLQDKQPRDRYHHNPDHLLDQYISSSPE